MSGDAEATSVVTGEPERLTIIGRYREVVWASLVPVYEALVAGTIQCEAREPARLQPMSALLIALISALVGIGEASVSVTRFAEPQSSP